MNKFIRNNSDMVFITRVIKVLWNEWDITLLYPYPTKDALWVSSTCRHIPLKSQMSINFYKRMSSFL
jgi:hypothetical protein